MNLTLYRLIEKNVRVPNQVLADLRAQISALNSSEREVQKLLAEFDADEFAAYMADMIDYSERLTRAGIATLPDGEADFTEWIDDYGVEGTEPVRILVKLTITGDCIDVNFAGTSPQKTGALNLNYAFTASCTYAAVRTAWCANTGCWPTKRRSSCARIGRPSSPGAFSAARPARHPRSCATPDPPRRSFPPSSSAAWKGTTF